MTNAALRGKPDAGNPHVRFDEGEVAPAATPRRGSLLYKKLMFMLAAAVMAVSVQAASVKWTCTNVKEDGVAVSGIAFFVNEATLSQSSLSSLKSASDFTTALSGAYSWTPSTAGNYGATVANADLGLADASDYSAYLLIFDTATITDESKYYTTTVKNVATYAGTETASVAWAGQSSRISSVGWTSVSDVPEPTSGLLMLVGLAGLALRRKRA